MNQNFPFNDHDGSTVVRGVTFSSHPRDKYDIPHKVNAGLHFSGARLMRSGRQETCGSPVFYRVQEPASCMFR